MTAAIALALLVRQGPRPTLPAGTSPAFARVALDVEAKLVAGDLKGARETARALPLRAPRIVWEDEKMMPPELLKAREGAFARVVASWGRGVRAFAPKAVKDAPDVTIGFAPVLPDGPGGIPLATTVEMGPPVRATIGLTRGKPGMPLRDEEMGMEMAYALGRYLGINEAPFPGSAMNRDARPGLLSFMPRQEDARIAEANLSLAERLRAAVEMGKPIGLTAPSVKLAKERLDLGTVMQGTPIRAWIPLENTGVGPLDYWINPDCSCFSRFPPARLEASGSGRALVLINTMESIGRQDKMLLLVSNDPLRPNIEIPVTFTSKPPYRMFRPGGSQVVVPDGGGAFDVFLFTPPDSTLKPVSVRWDGLEATVKMTPWSGDLADPEMGEEALPRKGWRLRVSIPANSVKEGRALGNLNIQTNSRIFGTLLYAMEAQKGIIPLQDSVYFGDMVQGASITAIVSRPNAPFKILSVDAGPLKATWSDRRGGWEYGIGLTYTGGSAKGDFSVPVKVHTDDPKQPVVEFLASGNVK